MPEEPIPCEYKFLQYGMLEFRGYTKTSLNGQVVYSEDGITAKYSRYTLEAEFILTRELVSTVTYEREMQYQDGGSDVEISPDSVDVAMDKIKYQLQRPNCRLVFWHHGAGIIMNVLGSSESEESEDSTYKYKNHLRYNLIEGPTPEILSWEPMGLNNAIKCKWRCTFNLPVEENIQDAAFINDARVAEEGRQKAGLQTFSALFNNWVRNYVYIDGQAGGAVGDDKMANYVLSVTEEHEFEVSEEGTVVSTLTGSIEFSGSGAIFLNNKGNPSAIPRLIQMMTHYFEPLHPTGFSRTQKYKLLKNKRTLEYTITDRELQSDNPFMPNIVKADVTHSVNSDLLSDNIMQGAGFLSWATTFEGTLTVAPGKWKGWAWIAIMCIIQQRIMRSTVMGADSAARIKDELSGVKTNAAINSRVEARHLLTKVSIKEQIYTRQVSFTIGYLLITELEELFRNSGLFEPVHISWQGAGPYPANFGKVPVNLSEFQPNSYNGQWSQSRESMASTQNVFGYRGPLMPGYNVIFNPYIDIDNNRGNLATTTPPKNVLNPEKVYYETDVNGDPVVPSTETVDVGPYNAPELAQHRRNLHLETFKNLDFSSGYDITSGFVNGMTPIPGIQRANEIMDNIGGAASGSTASPVIPPDNPETNPYKGADAKNPYWLRASNPRATWVSYDMDFEVVRNENTVMFPIISPQLAESRHNNNARPSSSVKDHIGFAMLGTSNAIPTYGGTDYEKFSIQSFGLPVSMVRCTGSAVRVGYPIPTPSLVGVQRFDANQDDFTSSTVIKAYRAGTSVWSHKQLNRSADMPVFGATWDITYVLKGDPVCVNMGFRSPRPNEFV